MRKWLFVFLLWATSALSAGDDITLTQDEAMMLKNEFTTMAQIIYEQKKQIERLQSSKNCI